MTACSVSGCDTKVLARGYCATHYSRWQKGTPLNTPIQKKNPGAICEVEGCERRRVGSGLCTVHFQRRRTGVPLDQPVRKVFHTNDLHERLRRYAPEGEPDECWVWTRALNKGYGMIAIGGGKLRGAHIVAWELANDRKLPEGMVIRHTCDNPPCTNDAHLLLGTHGDNVNDRVERGPTRKGEGNAQVKLSTDDILQIREMADAGWRQKIIAERFGIKQANVSMIVTRKTWKHV